MFKLSSLLLRFFEGASQILQLASAFQAEFTSPNSNLLQGVDVSVPVDLVASRNTCQLMQSIVERHDTLPKLMARRPTVTC